MKRLMIATPLVALAVLLLSTPDASAFGRRKKHCAEDCAPGCAPAPMNVTWVEQTVTAYRTEWRTRQVPVEVSRPVERIEVKKEKRTVIVPTWVTEKSTVSEVVPTWVTEKSTVTEVVPTWVTEKRTERVVVPTWVREKQTVTEVVPTWVKEKQTVREVVPTVVKEKVNQTVWQANWVKETHYRNVCRPVTSVVNRPVVRCRMVSVACVDPCTGCAYTSCRPETYVENVPCTVVNYVTEQQPIEVTVNRPRAVQQQVEVNVCRYVTQERPVEVMVCRHVTQSRPVEVMVCKHVTQERPVEYRVCKHVTQQRPVEYRVCKYVTQQRPVEYQVCKHVSKTEDVNVSYVHTDWKKETVMRTEHYCERVPYQTTVRVPVCVPTPPCAY